MKIRNTEQRTPLYNFRDIRKYIHAQKPLKTGRLYLGLKKKSVRRAIGKFYII